MMQQEDKSSQTMTNFTPVNWDLFKAESERLKSFDNWTVPFIDKNKLAAAGFVYFNNGDMVQCVFCKVQIGNWSNGDDPLLEHVRMSPCCRFLMKLPVGNIPINSDSELVIPQMSHRSCDTCGPYGMMDVPQRGNVENNGVKMEETEKMAYPAYSTLELRLQTFVDWPIAIKQTPAKLSEAGFYYTGKGDQTICYFCGQGLKDWEEDDDPWIQHALWFPNCKFILLSKGNDFVQEVQSLRTGKLKPTSEKKDNTSDLTVTAVDGSSTQSTTRNESDQPGTSGSGDDARMCKICYLKELGVVFVPCGHIVACVECALSLETSVCPVCRKPIQERVRARIP